MHIFALSSSLQKVRKSDFTLIKTFKHSLNWTSKRHNKVKNSKLEGEFRRSSLTFVAQPAAKKDLRFLGLQISKAKAHSQVEDRMIRVETSKLYLSLSKMPPALNHDLFSHMSDFWHRIRISISHSYYMQK